ncbi:MAG: AAA family ATPase [archaeon]
MTNQQDLKTTVILLEEEVKRLSQPPYVAATVVGVAEKTARISLDSGESFETPVTAELKAQIKKGARILVNGQAKAFLQFSEFPNVSGEVVTVEEIIDNRARVNYKGETVMVENALEDLKKGEEVLLNRGKEIIVARLGTKKTKYTLEKIPVAPWSNIGGLEQTIATIKEEIEMPIVHKETYERYGRRPAKGILLFGPPGCGKTMIARSIAYNLTKLVNGEDKEGTGQFITINGPEILDKWLGNSEGAIRRIYEAAREAAEESKAPVVVFIDEADSLLKKRGTGISSDISDTIVPQFLAEMDGLNGHSNVITILATNREDVLDPAVIRDGRIDTKIRIPRPDYKAAKQIFGLYLKSKPILAEGNEDGKDPAEVIANEIYNTAHPVYRVVTRNGQELGRFAYKHLISGAKIKGIVDRASSYAIKRELDTKKKSGISRSDLINATKEEFREQGSFAQTLVEGDWEDVFGDKGRQYERAYKEGLVVLENILSKTEEQLNEIREVKQ